MSGHSKWHNIKHKKMAEDQRRGKIFTRIMREIIIAVKQGGADSNNNARLRAAIESAKDSNMPKENIERAIRKATGESSSEKMEEVFFEGYGPGGTAILVRAITDNKNRTSPQIRAIFSRYGGSLAEAGSVSWIFDRRGIFSFPKTGQDTQNIADIAIENGALDIKEDEDFLEIECDPKDFENMKKKFSEKGLKYEKCEITLIPKTTVSTTGREAEQVLKLSEALDEHEDVQNVWANFDIPVEEMKKFASV